MGGGSTPGRRGAWGSSPEPAPGGRYGVRPVRCPPRTVPAPYGALRRVRPAVLRGGGATGRAPYAAPCRALARAERPVHPALRAASPLQRARLGGPGSPTPNPPPAAHPCPDRQKAGSSEDEPAFEQQAWWPRQCETSTREPGCPRSERGHRSRLARDLAGLDARGADVEPLRRPTDHGTHALDVGVPATGRTAVRVRNVVAEARPLATDVAVGSHGSLQRLQMHLQ